MLAWWRRINAIAAGREGPAGNLSKPHNGSTSRSQPLLHPPHRKLQYLFRTRTSQHESLSEHRQPLIVRKQAQQTSSIIQPEGPSENVAIPVQLPGRRMTKRRRTKCKKTDRRVKPAPAAASARKAQLVILPDTCNGHAAWLLEDGGAQMTFLSDQSAHKHGIPLQQGSAATIKMANGHQRAAHTARVRVKLGNRQQECTLKVTPMPEYDAILGKPWLDRLATRTDWVSNTCSWKSTGGKTFSNQFYATAADCMAGDELYNLMLAARAWTPINRQLCMPLAPAFRSALADLGRGHGPAGGMSCCRTCRIRSFIFVP